MNRPEFITARKRLGLTQQQLAEQLGTPPGDIYSLRAVKAWESGQNKVPPAVGKLINLMIKARGK